MAYSTQRAVSDGTMSYIDVSIGYQYQSDIAVYYNDLPADASTWAWSSTTSKRIVFTTPIAAGVEVMLKRTSTMNKVINVFASGAKFNNSSMDVNFSQMLYLAQEAVEGAALTDIFNDVDFHAYKIKNLGLAVDDNDAITYGQVKTLSTGAYASAQASAASASAADASAKAAALSATAADTSAKAAATSASGASSSAGTATTQAAASKASADAAATSAANAAAAAAPATDLVNKVNDANSKSDAAVSTANSASSTASAAQQAVSTLDGQAMKKANNLSDVANVVTARTSLRMGLVEVARAVVSNRTTSLDFPTLFSAQSEYDSFEIVGEFQPNGGNSVNGSASTMYGSSLYVRLSYDGSTFNATQMYQQQNDYSFLGDGAVNSNGGTGTAAALVQCIAGTSSQVASDVRKNLGEFTAQVRISSWGETMIFSDAVSVFANTGNGAARLFQRWRNWIYGVGTSTTITLPTGLQFFMVGNAANTSWSGSIVIYGRRKSL